MIDGHEVMDFVHSQVSSVEPGPRPFGMLVPLTPEGASDIMASFNLETHEARATRSRWMAQPRFTRYIVILYAPSLVETHLYRDFVNECQTDEECVAVFAVSAMNDHWIGVYPRMEFVTCEHGCRMDPVHHFTEHQFTITDPTDFVVFDINEDGTIR